jgi:molecular chaperone GrpE
MRLLETPGAAPISPRNATAKPTTTMNPEDQTPQAPLQSPVENGAADVDLGLGGDAARIADLEARVAELTDSHLRAKAETENARRRADEEVAKARKYAVEGFADSLLPVKDSLEAAIATPGAGVEQVLEGVHATLRQLVAALERNKVSQINPPAGTRFDPHQHQAISMVPAEQEANTIVTVLQKGYLIADRVLRPALVTVAAPK